MITFDFENRSYADLKKVGSWAYSLDPTTDVICCAWGIDYESVQSWWPGKYETDHMPRDLFDALSNGHVIEAHNVAFERSIWENVMAPKYGWALPDDDQWRDTMAVASYYALPAGLDELAHVLGFPGKDPEGGRLMTKYSKLYLKTAKMEIPEDDFKKFVNYCEFDVKLEQAVSDFMGDLPERELPVFLLDQKINRRGLFLDINGIRVAGDIVEQRGEALTEEFREITGYNPTQRDKVLKWFRDNGYKLDNLQAKYLGDLMDDGEIPSGPARRALEIRLAINKASTKKLDAMIRQSDDGKDRARFQTRYHGASTGRWTGNGFQPYNLKRNDEYVDPDQLVRDIMHGDAAWLDVIYGDAMDAISKASRHWIMAEPENKILAGDFVSIEAVILACLAGEEWKINAFKRGEPIYELMGCKIHSLPEEAIALAISDKEEFKRRYPCERKDGKTGELAGGYQGWLGAWLKFDNSGRHTDDAIKGFMGTWREKHPATVEFWGDLQAAAIRATRDGKRHQVGQIGFEVVDEWLTMILPNEKRIWYWQPQVRMRPPRWCKPEVHEKCATGECGHVSQPSLSYMAKKEGQWRRVHTYGGKLTENACQATSREILVPAMLRAEEAGYHVILSVYDEIVAEVPKDFGNLEEFLGIMKRPLPVWAKDWPIEADGWQGKRYRK